MSFCRCYRLLQSDDVWIMMWFGTEEDERQSAVSIICNGNACGVCLHPCCVCVKCVIYIMLGLFHSSSCLPMQGTLKSNFQALGSWNSARNGFTVRDCRSKHICLPQHQKPLLWSQNKKEPRHTLPCSWINIKNCERTTSEKHTAVVNMKCCSRPFAFRKDT